MKSTTRMKVMTVDEFATVANQLANLSSCDCAVVLIGSAARGQSTERSDIDILFVANEKVPQIPIISGYHIKFITEATFLRRLREGEDFEAWCVRLGVTLLDRGIWDRIKEASQDVWPRWETKVVHGATRLFLASQQFILGDLVATQEELIFVLGHITRGILLKQGIFPLSRPELADQVRSIGYLHLADIHENLRQTCTRSKSDLSIALRYSKKLLVYLDRMIYSKVALEHAKTAIEKKAKGTVLRSRSKGRAPE